jgi:hypothetical protein
MLCLFFFIYFYAQTITVYVGVGNDKWAKFEREMIESLIVYHNSNTQSKYSLKFERVLFIDMFKKIEQFNASANVIGLQSISMNDERKKRFDFSVPYMINRPFILKSKKNKNEPDLNDSKTVYGTIKGTIYEPILLTRGLEFNQKIIIKPSVLDVVNELNKG